MQKLAHGGKNYTSQSENLDEHEEFALFAFLGEAEVIPCTVVELSNCGG